MTLEQLRIFVTVAERQHMTRAAETLGLTQSAVSAAVAALERRYATRLFDRIGRGLTLSEAGRVFLPEARTVLAQAETASLALDDLAGLRRGQLTLFASQTVSSYWLPPLMVAFTQAHPQVALKLAVGNTARVARALIEGEAELGFVEGAIDEPALAHTRIGSDRLAIVVAPDHPLAHAIEVSWNDLAAADWALREPGSGTRSEFEQIVANHDLDPARLKVLIELPSNEALLAAAAAGGLISVVSELAATPMILAGRIRRLPFDLPRRPFELLTHKERRRSHAGAAFINLFKAISGRRDGQFDVGL